MATQNQLSIQIHSEHATVSFHWRNLWAIAVTAEGIVIRLAGGIPDTVFFKSEDAELEQAVYKNIAGRILGCRSPETERVVIVIGADGSVREDVIFEKELTPKPDKIKSKTAYRYAKSKSKPDPTLDDF